MELCATSCVLNLSSSLVSIPTFSHADVLRKYIDTFLGNHLLVVFLSSVIFY